MIYSVKEIAEFMGMTEHAIRYYTDQGLMPCKRDKNNRRVFDEESVNWLKGIKCLRGCGVSIEDIKKYSLLCMSENDNIQARFEFIKKQRDLAYIRLKEAQELVVYMDNKVKHYEDIIAGKKTDDTNPSKNTITIC